MELTRHGPSHPLCLAATAALLINDFVLKALLPGLLTGKLSDGAWLVVAPVVLASIVVRLGLPERVARAGALGAIGAAFVTLQLWPPLGEAWVSLFGGAHVADPLDLVALPALALAPLCWRPTRPRPLALPLAALACVATSWTPCDDVRLPEDGATEVDPNEPLYLGFGYQQAVHDTAGIRSAISLRPLEGGGEVDLILATVSNQIVICPRGGLAPSTTYRWEVEPFYTDSTNHVRPPGFSETGVTTFTTAATSDQAPITTERQCRRRALGTRACAPWDTAFPDTGDTFDTGDSSDSSDSGDSGGGRRRW